MTTECPQTGQAAVVHAHPDAAIAALEPRADAIAGQAVAHRVTHMTPIGENTEQAVAIMIQPETAIAVFMRTHATAGGRPEQSAPFCDLTHPGPAGHLAKTVAIQ